MSKPGASWTDIVAGNPLAWIRDTLEEYGDQPGGFDDVGPCDGQDRDCDHYFDKNDNCPDNDNIRQYNSDGDMVGDDCDNCPWSANNQANCNAEAENLVYLSKQHAR